MSCFLCVSFVVQIKICNYFNDETEWKKVYETVRESRRVSESVGESKSVKESVR